MFAYTLSLAGPVDAHAHQENHEVAIERGGQALLVNHGAILGSRFGRAGAVTRRQAGVARFVVCAGKDLGRAGAVQK